MNRTQPSANTTPTDGLRRNWGAGVTTWMAKQHVEGLAAIHLNLPILFPPPLEGEANEEEKVTIAQLVEFNEQKSG